MVCRLVAPFGDCKGAAVERPMDSTFEHHRQAVDSIVVRSCSGIDDDAVTVEQPIDAIATMSLMSAFVQSDLVAAVFVLVLLAHPNVVHVSDERNKIAVAADLKPMFVAVVAAFFPRKYKINKQNQETEHELIVSQHLFSQAIALNIL